MWSWDLTPDIWGDYTHHFPPRFHFCDLQQLLCFHSGGAEQTQRGFGILRGCSNKPLNWSLWKISYGSDIEHSLSLVWTSWGSRQLCCLVLPDGLTVLTLPPRNASSFLEMNQKENTFTEETRNRTTCKDIRKSCSASRSPESSFEVFVFVSVDEWIDPNVCLKCSKTSLMKNICLKKNMSCPCHALVKVCIHDLRQVLRKSEFWDAPQLFCVHSHDQGLTQVTPQNSRIWRRPWDLSGFVTVSFRKERTILPPRTIPITSAPVTLLVIHSRM